MDLFSNSIQLLSGIKQVTFSQATPLVRCSHPKVAKKKPQNYYYTKFKNSNDPKIFDPHHKSRFF